MAGKSAVERCSVGTHCNSPCFLSRYVKESFDLHTLDNLDDDTRRTIYFRTNMKDIPTICNHHKATYTSRFTSFKQSKKCDNPFDNHSKTKRPLGTSIVNLVSCMKLPTNTNLHFYPGQRLCVDCIKEFHLLILHNTNEKESLLTEKTAIADTATQVIIVLIVLQN